MFGGVLGALVLAIVGDAIPLERRSSAMGWVMTAFSAASVVGVPAGIWLAAEYGWHFPFLVTGLLSAAFVVLAYFFVPSMRGHLRKPELLGGAREPWYAPYRAIFTDANQRAALLFTLTLMLGHFTIIPFIAPYMQINIGFGDKQVSLIYLIGGLLTVVLLPLLGKLADRYGRMLIFTIASIGALGSIFAITNLDTTSIPLALLVTSSFFVVSSGRTVPATTMITAVVHPENRAGFMSIRQSVNEIALFFSSLIAGFIIVEGADGRLEHYDWLGYFTMGMTVVAVYAGSRLRAVA
jgi:predicted MFS family arabinose efflux permease